MDNITEVQSILDEQKDRLKEGDYLRLTNLLKTLYIKKEQEDKTQLWEVEYLIPRTNIVITIDPDRDSDSVINGLTVLKHKTDIYIRKTIVKSTQKPSLGCMAYYQLERMNVLGRNIFGSLDRQGECTFYNSQGDEELNIEIEGEVWVLGVKLFSV